MELLTKTLFKEYDLTDEEKITILLFYQIGIMEHLSQLMFGYVNGVPTLQRYLLN